MLYADRQHLPSKNRQIQVLLAFQNPSTQEKLIRVRRSNPGGTGPGALARLVARRGVEHVGPGGTGTARAPGPLRGFHGEDGHLCGLNATFGAKGIATRSKDATFGAPGLTTSSFLLLVAMHLLLLVNKLLETIN